MNAGQQIRLNSIAREETIDQSGMWRAALAGGALIMTGEFLTHGVLMRGEWKAVRFAIFGVKTGKLGWVLLAGLTFGAAYAIAASYRWLCSRVGAGATAAVLAALGSWLVFWGFAVSRMYAWDPYAGRLHFAASAAGLLECLMTAFLAKRLLPPSPEPDGR